MSHDLAATFILVSYNQEGTVEASARAVLAQEGDPLQIILSDDCSTDQTYNILQKLAAEYQGPHEVTVRQNARNLGVNEHVRHAIKEAQCDFLLWSAGDDVSLPQRARVTLDAYALHGSKLIYSDAQTRRPDGSPGTNAYRKALFYRDEFTVLEAATSFSLYLGAAVSWHKDLFYKYGGLPKERAHEDLILGFRAILEGSLHYVPQELIIYQEDAGVGSELSQSNGLLENRTRRQAVLKGKLTVLEQRLKDVDTFGISKDHPITSRIARMRDRMAMRLCYYEGGLGARAGHPLRLIHALGSEWLRDIRNR